MNSHLDAGDGLQSADSNEYLRWAKASPQFHSHFGTLPQSDYQDQAAGEPDSKTLSALDWRMDQLVSLDLKLQGHQQMMIQTNC